MRTSSSSGGWSGRSRRGWRSTRAPGSGGRRGRWGPRVRWWTGRAGGSRCGPRYRWTKWSVSTGTSWARAATTRPGRRSPAGAPGPS
ncbi:hypothetical protein B6264_13530 [Kitasatospora aureofaciens]|nr:hypothetical protein B6264_13530 [Kitasatospora aureofaciens]